MKRRLFIKRAGMAAAGLFAAPYLFQSCKNISMAGRSASSFPAFPAQIPDFKNYAHMFDEAIAELRLFGAGPIVPGEAEAFSFGLDDVSEQIVSGAEAESEINPEFAEFGPEMIAAASELAEASHEFPFIEDGTAEFEGVAENYGLLKISRSTAILHAATLATFPQPERAPTAKKMYAEAEVMYKALMGGFEGGAENPSLNNAELEYGSEQLLGNAELYVGSSNMLSGTQEFYFSSAELADTLSDSDDIAGFSNNFATSGQAASAELAEGPGILAELPGALAEFAGGFAFAESFRLTKGADFLLLASNAVELSAEQHDTGLQTFNFGETIVGAAEESVAPTWVGPAESLIDTSEKYLQIAKGEAAELGAERMIAGSEELTAEAEFDASELQPSAENFHLGAEQYIGGLTNFYGSVQYDGGALQYAVGAELFAEGISGAEKMFTNGAERTHHGAEDFELGAEVLTTINTAEGAANVLPAAESIYLGAEKLFGIAEAGAAEIGALEMVEGAELMLVGAEVAVGDGAELSEGSLELFTGSSELQDGVSEFASAE